MHESAMFENESGSMTLDHVLLSSVSDGPLDGKYAFGMEASIAFHRRLPDEASDSTILLSSSSLLPPLDGSAGPGAGPTLAAPVLLAALEVGLHL